MKKPAPTSDAGQSNTTLEPVAFCPNSATSPLIKVHPDNEAAISFLKQWAPAGPWVLTCIQPDRKAIDTATFFPATETDLLQWLETYNGKRNIYFHVNPPLKPLTKKA